MRGITFIDDEKYLSFVRVIFIQNTVKTFPSFTKHLYVRSTNVQKCSKILPKFLASNAGCSWVVL